MAFFLVGYMACGKTTLGRALAATGLAEFVDLDEYIEAKSGLSPAEWFARHGENAFREAEKAALKEVCETTSAGRPLVIGCGGGTPCNDDAMDYMAKHGTIVWLEASLDRTVRRLLDADGQRPLVAGMNEAQLREFVPGHARERALYYVRAHARFDSSRLDTEEEVDMTVKEFASRFL